MKKTYNIAIDGPAGAGKSTIARLAAGQLGFIYVDTGAMYRAMALYFLRRGANLADEEAVGACLQRYHVEIRYEAGEQQVLLNGENVTGQIRTDQVGNAASAISKYPAVRAALLELQREPGAHQQRDHGRAGHRHPGAAGCGPEDLSHRQHCRAGDAPLQGVSGEGEWTAPLRAWSRT